ncbi:MAG: hypothetical protein CMM00_01810 [Rhodopirellula sp.]|nr:hypothetical protein [Rhodopirellula sp.]
MLGFAVDWQTQLNRTCIRIPLDHAMTLYFLGGVGFGVGSCFVVSPSDLSYNFTSSGGARRFRPARNNQCKLRSGGGDRQQVAIWFPRPRRCFPFAELIWLSIRMDDLDQSDEGDFACMRCEGIVSTEEMLANNCPHCGNSPSMMAQELWARSDSQTESSVSNGVSHASPSVSCELKMPRDLTEQLNVRNELIRSLEQLSMKMKGGGMPIVDASVFFGGNFDDASIVANAGWKGLPEFPELVKEIERISRLPNVDSVSVSVLEWPEVDDVEEFDLWPQGENLVIVSSMSREALEHEISLLKHDGVLDGWAYEKDGRSAETLPHVPAGSRLYTVCWD